jgi:PAS domain S-box-containing protein
MQAQFWSMRPMQLAAPTFTRSREFLAMAEATGDLIAVLDAAGRRLYANPALCRLLPAGVAMTGSDSFAHIHPDDRSAIRKLFMRVLSDRQGREARYRIVDRHGRLRHLESRSCLVRDEATGSQRLMVVSRERLDDDARLMAA